MHYLVADLARTITLVPGDLVLSGTPANSRPVEPGDVVTVEVEGLGALTNRIVDGPTPVRDDVGAQPTETRRRCARPPSAVTGSTAACGRRRVPAPSTTSPPWTTLMTPPPSEGSLHPRVSCGEAPHETLGCGRRGGRVGVARPPDRRRRVSSPSTFEDRSPLDWSWKLADVARGDAATADAAVGAAVDAFPAWAALGAAGRGAAAAPAGRPRRRPHRGHRHRRDRRHGDAPRVACACASSPAAP